MAGRIGRIDERGMIKTFIYLAEACVLLSLVRRVGDRACSHPFCDKFGQCLDVLPANGRTFL